MKTHNIFLKIFILLLCTSLVFGLSPKTTHATNITVNETNIGREVAELREENVKHYYMETAPTRQLHLVILFTKKTITGIGKIMYLHSLIFANQQPEQKSFISGNLQFKLHPLLLLFSPRSPIRSARLHLEKNAIVLIQSTALNQATTETPTKLRSTNFTTKIYITFFYMSLRLPIPTPQGWSFLVAQLVLLIPFIVFVFKTKYTASLIGI